jgi:hypothetical protein
MTRPVTDPEISDPNPHNLTFPYPLIGNVKRRKGQGCTVCVHYGYCPAVYWFKRYGQDKLDDWNGIQCGTWSTNPADKATVVAQPDLDENQYMYEQGIGSEANRNGITDPVTGSPRDQN